MLARLVLVFAIFGVFALSTANASTTSNKWVQPLMVEELDNIRLLDDALLEISNSAENEVEAEGENEIEAENENENENENELLEGIDQEIAQTVENEVAAETANEAEAELSAETEATNTNENENENESEDAPVISFSAEDVAKLESELEEELSSPSFAEVSADLGVSVEDQQLLASPVGVLPDGHEDHHGDALQDAAQRALSDSVNARTIMEQSDSKLENYQKEVRELIAAKGHPAEMTDSDLSTLSKLVEKLKEHRTNAESMRSVYKLATKRTQRLVEAFKRHVARSGLAEPPQNAGAAIVAATAVKLVGVPTHTF